MISRVLECAPRLIDPPTPPTLRHMEHTHNFIRQRPRKPIIRFITVIEVMLTWYGIGVLLSTINRTVPQWQLPLSVMGMASGGRYYYHERSNYGGSDTLILDVCYRGLTAYLLRSSMTVRSRTWLPRQIPLVKLRFNIYLYIPCANFLSSLRRLATLVVSQNFPPSTQCQGLYESLFPSRVNYPI